MLLQVQLKLETSLPPYSPLACDCPSGCPYIYFLPIPTSLRARVFLEKAESFPTNHLQDHRRRVSTNNTSFLFYPPQPYYLQGDLKMRIQVEREDTDGVENREMNQNSELATFPMCLSYSWNELKI